MDYLHKLFSYTIILNSLSPRRKQLLESMGLKVLVSKQNIEETYPQDLSNTLVAQYIAKKKNDAYKKTLNSKEILLSSDTIVLCNGIILGKPKDEQQAKDMLSLLSSSWHSVITGCSIKTNEKEIVFSQTTQVKFKQLSKEEINYYINIYRPFDKAGSYGIQEWIGIIGIEEIKGDFYNVMGLPTRKLYEEMINLIN